MISIIIGILFINMISAVVYGYNLQQKGESLWIALLFITLPVLGYILYFVPLLLCQRMGTQGFDRELLVNRNKRRYTAEEPAPSQELDIVPIGDALAASDNNEKRALVLNQLREDLGNNYKYLLGIGNDSDSECVHYVAAAKMEVYSRLQKEYSDKWNHYCEKNSEGTYHAAMHSLTELIESSLLSKKEILLYKERYIKNMESVHEKTWIDSEIINYADYLADCRQYNKINKLLKKYRLLLANETLFIKIISQAHMDRNEKVFNLYLKKLTDSRNLQVSKVGRKTINRLVGSEV